MAAYDTLRAAIDNYIKANGNKEITGTVLNDILNAMVSALGADTRFAGVAVPSTNPGNPEGNVVYFASQAGTYSNFGGIVLPLGIHILVWNGTTWTSQTWFSVDNTPTQNSQNLATSGGILQAIVDAVGVERLRAIGVEVTSCSFDGTTKKISFFNSANTTLFQLDATAFVIDGMVSDVKIEDGNLVIQFNTDAGKQDIEIPLTDIFNPANYYTKTAIDALLALYYTKTETDALLTAINNKLADGCLYRGMAEPTTNPPTPTTKVFYIATKAGTYTNFGNIAVTEGITILKYDGSNWSKEQISYSDGVFDISAYNGTSYADLSAALGTNGANIPENLRKGGMSVKFVQSSDNKYVQCRCLSQTFSSNKEDWRNNDEIIDEITEKTVRQSPNIINSATTVQYAVNPATGQLLVTPIYADYRTTDYISVSEGDIFVFNNNVYEGRYATYDSSRECVPKDANYVSLITYAGTYDGQSYNYTGRRDIDNNKYGVLVIPNGVSYIRVCAASQADMNGAMLIKIGTISEMLSSELPEANKKTNTAPVFYATFILGADYDLNNAEYIPYGTITTYKVKGISDVEEDIDDIEGRLDGLEPEVSNIEGYIADKDSEPVEDSQKMIDSGGAFNGMIGLKTILGYSEQTVDSPNIYNKTTNVDGFYLNPKIETPVTNASYCYSQKIDVTPGKIILYNKRAVYSFFHMYDANGDFVAATTDVNDSLNKLTPAYRSNDDSVWNYFTVPSGVYAMRFSGAITDMNVAMFILIDDLSEMGDYDISTYIPYGTYKKYNSSVLDEMSGELGGKKIIVIGDSMVYGNTVGTSNAWSAKIAEKVGLDYEVSSSGTTSKTENVMVNAGVNGVMLSNNNAPFASNISDAVINRYSGMDSDADYVVVFAGTNDAWALSRNEIQLGAIDSIDDTTFNGALNVLMQGLLTKYPSGKIAFITPYTAPSSDAGAASREAIINAIKAACIRNGGIPCFDNSIVGGIDWNNTAQKTALTQNDGTHLNATGHAWVSTKYKAFMESL